MSGAGVYRNSTVDRDQLDSQLALISSMKIAAAWAASTEPEKLDTEELEALERRTIEAQGQLDVFSMFLKIEEHGFRELAQATNSGKT